MNTIDFAWENLTIPIQEEYDDVEFLNPVQAYRMQAYAINMASPIYAELEEVDIELQEAERLIKKVRTRILAQNMPLPSSSTRTNDLVDGFILNRAAVFINKEGNQEDISDYLINLETRHNKLTSRKILLERRLRAIEAVAERAETILNWVKHEAKVEYGRR